MPRTQRGAIYSCVTLRVPNSEFDGESDCRCKQGFNQVGNSCVPATAQAAGAAGARGGKAAGAAHAAGAAGAGGANRFSAAEIEHYTQQCQQLKGPYWVFDGVDDCKCAAGAQMVGGDCQPAGGAAGAARGGSAWGGGGAAAVGGGRGGAAAAAGGAVAGRGAAEESLKERNDKLCRDRFGPGAEVRSRSACCRELSHTHACASWRACTQAHACARRLCE